ncbi:hypothetical protein FQN57_000428 [Myotisia sp. PD_48]|nr:hypothetical protein FQN57_000428 [Myotisia sp. PD_48]
MTNTNSILADSQARPTDTNSNQTRVGSSSASTNERGLDADACVTSAPNNEGQPEYIPRPKRIACAVCRKRKLRCDGAKPSCGNCSRLGHDCAYNEVRKKSGPKRGYVKQLEARLAQVETLLKGHDSVENVHNSGSAQDYSYKNSPQNQPSQQRPLPDLGRVPNPITPSISPNGIDFMRDIPNPALFPDQNPANEPQFVWEMVGLGIEEPLPAQDVVDELNEIYFHKIHPSMPIIHRPRYYAASNLAPSMRPPVCLRYIMWAHAAAVTDKYIGLHPHFYQRARKYIELDQMKGLGETMISVAHAQAWDLIAAYEFKMMYFPRAWMSTGHGMRLALMMGLHRQDGAGLDVKQCLPPPRDWTEREERRRTFWGAFCQDRYASVGTGWPMIVDERDILTNLPASEEAFINCRSEPTSSLSDVLSGQGTSSLSPFAGNVLLACLFGRNLHHLHRVSTNERDHDLNGEFWKRHRALDNILLHTSLSLPNHLRLPDGIGDPSIVFCNMCIHTSTICLHQAAIFKAEKNEMPGQISAESKRRCIIAADQITNIMKMISHTDLSTMNPFLAFCLYVASRVFVQYLKSRPQDQAVRSSLQFLLSAMNALKRRAPLAESFLVQLDVDLEGSGIFDNDGRSKFAFSMQGPAESQARRFATNHNIPHLTAQCSISILDPKRFENDTTNSTPPAGTNLPTEPQLGSLPSRSKPYGQSPPGMGSHDSSNSSIPIDFTNIPILSIPDGHLKPLSGDMDMSTETSGGSERYQSNSDNTTPNTNNASSTGSFSPGFLEQPSPPNSFFHHQQQRLSHVVKSTSSTNNSTIYNTNIQSSSTTGTSSFVEKYPPNPGTPSMPPISNQNPFAFPDGWDFPQPQPRPPDIETMPTPSSSAMEAMISSLDDVNWTQCPGVIDWNDWK